MSEPPLVTVLIPARNEASDIGRCLRRVLAQDHPADRMEIVLVDGGSTDGTTDVATKMLRSGDVSWRIVDNPAGTTPSNLNAGLAAATGEVVCRVDARSLVPPDYVRTCASVLRDRRDVIVVGGSQVTTATDESPTTVGIARALNNRFAMGGSRYRSGAPSGPADTVYLGAFRAADLRRAGGWDERFSTNQDFELNRRLGRNGVVWFDARLRVEYLPRRSVGALWRQYHRFGRWKSFYWRTTGDPPRPRQLVLLAAACTAPMTALAFIGRGSASGRRAGAVAIVGATALALVDHLGSEPADVTPASRVVAAVATATTSAAWVSGVLRGLVFSPARIR